MEIISSEVIHLSNKVSIVFHLCIVSGVPALKFTWHFNVQLRILERSFHTSSWLALIILAWITLHLALALPCCCPLPFLANLRVRRASMSRRGSLKSSADDLLWVGELSTYSRSGSHLLTRFFLKAKALCIILYWLNFHMTDSLHGRCFRKPVDIYWILIHPNI